MKILIQTVMLTFMLSLLPQTQAEIIFYNFDDPVKEERFNKLISVLRCPKCQNNNLADSNSPLSVDLKDIIYEQIHAGKSDAEIVDFLKERYGDFIHYKPPMNSSTILLWFGPFLILVISAFFILRYLRMTKASDTVVDETEAEHMAKIQAWQAEVGDSDNTDTQVQDSTLGDNNR